MRIQILTSLTGCIAMLPLTGFAKTVKKVVDDRPNILFILADDMGKECLGCYGSTYSTPNLDNLAEQGVRFNYATSQPLSTPSRVELLTGRYNYKNYSKFGFLNQDQHTFAQLAQKAGYKTMIAGKWQLGTNDKLPAHFGFDNYCLYHLMFKGNKYAKPLFEVDGQMHSNCTEADYGPDYFCNYVINFIEKNKNHHFLAYYAMTLVHDPFQATPESDDWDINPKLRFNVNDKYFPDMVNYTDKNVGRLLKKLKELGLDKNTIVIFVGDNGTARYIFTPMKNGTKVQGGKALPLETGTAVPMIAYWGKYAKDYKKHTTVDMIDFTDFMPTFAEAMKIDIPKAWDTDGTSFFPVLKGEKNPNARDYVFVHYCPNHVPQAGVEKYSARYFKDRQYKLYSDGQFFDFVNDPEELRPFSPKSGKAKKVYDKFTALMKKLPKWKLGDKNVNMVILPGFEPISTGVGNGYNKETFDAFKAKQASESKK